MCIHHIHDMKQLVLHQVGCATTCCPWRIGRIWESAAGHDVKSTTIALRCLEARSHSPAATSTRRYSSGGCYCWLVAAVMLLLLLISFILFHEGLQLDRHSLPIREAPRCHSCLLGQCRLHPRWLTALPHQAHGLLQRLKGQLVLQTGSTHASRQLSSLRCSGKDLHIRGVRSR